MFIESPLLLRHCSRHYIWCHVGHCPDLKGLCVCASYLVISDSVQPHGLQYSRLPCPWDSPGKNTEVGCHFLLQNPGIELTFPTSVSCIAGELFFHQHHLENPKGTMKIIKSKHHIFFLYQILQNSRTRFLAFSHKASLLQN